MWTKWASTVVVSHINMLPDKLVIAGIIMFILYDWQHYPCPLWTNMNECKQMWADVNKCELMWINLSKCEPMWITVNKCKQMWTSVNKWDQIWTNVNKCE